MNHGRSREGYFKILRPVRPFFLCADPGSPSLSRTVYGSGVIFALRFIAFFFWKTSLYAFVISTKGQCVWAVRKRSGIAKRKSRGGEMLSGAMRNKARKIRHGCIVFLRPPLAMH